MAAKAKTPAPSSPELRSRPRKVPYSELTEESIRCRIASHRWAPYDASRVVGAFEVDEECDRCHSHRYTVVSNRGEVVSRRIKYAELYLSKDGRLTEGDRAAMRLQVIRWDYKL